MSKQIIQPIEKAIEEIRQGKMIILADDENRENEGDFVFAAEKCTPELVNMMMCYGRGLICQPMTPEDTKKLHLPQQVYNNEAHLTTAFTISIDASEGITTGISAKDRCTTILKACDPRATAKDLVRPGHIFPLEARQGGCLERPGHTEAAIDLVRLAGLNPQAVICEVLNEQGNAAKLDELQALAKTLGLHIYTIRDLVNYRLKHEPAVTRIETVELPTEFGKFSLHVFQSMRDFSKQTYLALTCGLESIKKGKVPLVRVHSEWSIVNLLNRLSHEEGSRLNLAMKKIAESECGAILFLRHTPEVQKEGGELKPDIWQSNGRLETLGSMDPNMGYGDGAQILRALGIRKMNLLSNSSTPFKGISHFGLEIVERLPLDYQHA